MNKKLTLLITIMLISVPLTGCTGEDEDKIDQLEINIQNNQSMMNELNSTVEGLSLIHI